MDLFSRGYGGAENGPLRHFSFPVGLFTFVGVFLFLNAERIGPDGQLEGGY